VYGMTARDILTGTNKISMAAMPEGVHLSADVGAVFKAEVNWSA
jgi:hypothetical protein